MIKKIKNMGNAWKFFFVVIIIFAAISLISPSLAKDSLETSYELLKKMFSSLVLAFIFMYAFNLFVSEKFVKKHLTKNIGIKQYLIVAMIGIFSTGPIYMWYAYLSELKAEGMNEGLMSIFLYNRAVKLPLLPIMISYFSIQTTIIISILTIIFSFINATLINSFNNLYPYENSNSSIK